MDRLSRKEANELLLRLAANPDTENAPALVQTLINRGVNLDYANSRNGYTALMEICSHTSTETDNDIKMLKILLSKHGIDVNRKIENGNTALLMACRRQDRKKVEMLMDYPDIDLHLADKEGRTPASFARFQGANWILEKIKAVEKKRFEEKQSPTPLTQTTCLICTNVLNERYALISCGHTGYCLECLDRVQSCPSCRKRIEGKLRIY
jgi:ankyrin repeat protein